MAELKTGVRVRAEGLGITSKSLTTFLLLFYNTRRGKDVDLALVAFAAGQLMYSAVMFFVYTAHIGDQHMWPKVPSASGYSYFVKLFQHPKLTPSLFFLSPAGHY
jgi:oligosaccharide translocation protein RFT1